MNEIIEVVEKETNEPFIIGYRFSPEEYENPGIRFEDTLYLVDKLADKELDYLHISIGNYKQVSRSESYQDKSMIEYINDKIDGRVPLISVGDIRTSADAEEALQNSEMVALGRVLLADPHWVSKVLSGREDIVRESVSVEERDALRLNTGVWGFMEAMMPDRIK